MRYLYPQSHRWGLLTSEINIHWYRVCRCQKYDHDDAEMLMLEDLATVTSKPPQVPHGSPRKADGGVDSDQSPYWSRLVIRDTGTGEP